MEILLNILAMTAAIACIIGWLWIAVMAFSEGEPALFTKNLLNKETIA
ncbi:hypothetical protein [Rhodopirellula europaea]